MKALNVFGIIFAWLLSIALVVMLIAAPLLFSMLSVLDPDNIVEVVVEGLTGDQASAAANPEKAYALQKLSASSKEKSLAESMLDALDLEELEDIAGQKIDEDVVAHVLASDAMKDVFVAYANDIANALTGESGKKEFTAKNLKKMVKANLDEIVEAVEEAGVSLSKRQEEEVKDKIDSAVKKNADKVIDLLPDPEEIAETVVEDNPAGEFLAMLLEQVNTAKVTVVGAIVVLSLLIFFLRIPGFRGLRWLASDLFVAGGFNVLFCIGLGIGNSAIKELAEDMDSATLEGVVRKLLAWLTTSMVIRTVILFVAAIVLLVVYYVLKNLMRKKKAGKNAAPVMTNPVFTPAATFVPTSAPAPIPAPIPTPAPVVAPVYAPVILEPELMTELTPEKTEEPATEQIETPAPEEAEVPAMEKTEVSAPEEAEVPEMPEEPVSVENEN